jgi:hypothetical protein
MPPPDGQLAALARARFHHLTPAELELVFRAPEGSLTICGPNANHDDPANDPAQADEWGKDREIRADLIRWLCQDRHARELVDPKGIQVFGAKVTEALDLSSVPVPFPLTLARCLLIEELNLRYAEIPAINLQGTWVSSIAADGVQVRNFIFLRNGFHAAGQVRLAGARIEGNIECDRGTIENPARPGIPRSGRALVADGAIVNGAVFLRNQFSAVGEVRLVGAQIGGNFDCTNATFKNPLRDRVEQSGIALHADGILVKGGVFLGLGFRAEGEVRLQAAQIGSALECSGGTFSDPSQKHGGGHALTADRVVVRGDVLFAQAFHAEGEVRLLGARIGGDLSCIGGTFINPPKADLPASNHALSAHTVTIGGNVFLRDGFHAEGEVSFTGAQIAGNLECTGGAFLGELNMQTASVKGALFWRSIEDPRLLRLNLENASVGALADNSEGWPLPGNLILDGFVYERFSGGAPKDAKERLDWLARQKEFEPHPYRQLANVLRDQGDAMGAQKVLFEMEGRRRQKEDRGWVARAWSFLFRNTVGYGYLPTTRAASCLVVLTAMGTLLFWGGYHAGSIVPTDKEAYSLFKNDHQVPPHYERFQAAMYSLENSFQLIKLGQAKRWQPDPGPQAANPFVKGCVLRFAHPFISTSFLRVWRWFQIISGWFFTAVIVGGLTGIVRKD